jgi:hypothetical protein
VIEEMNTARSTRMPVNILRVALISLAALATASCSKQPDPASKEASETVKPSQKIADHERTNEHESEQSGQAAVTSAEAEDSKSQPSADDIVEDCYAFVWLTKATLTRKTSGECPQCRSTGEAIHVLKFEGAKVERVSCTEKTCAVAVSIRASFNPSKGGTISGGLTGWIPPEQREQYSRGQTPPGEKAYHVKIIYRRKEGKWRPVEFG